MHRLSHASTTGQALAHRVGVSSQSFSQPPERPVRNGSWALPAPAGAYGVLHAWPSAEGWFDVVLDTLATPAGEVARRRAKVARDTLLRVAYADRQSADQATGRSVTTAHETVAAKLGMSSKTVQRARQLLEALELAVTVVEGRYLTVAERLAATASHGGRQLRAASTRALVMPASWRPPVREEVSPSPTRRRRTVENVYLPAPGEVHLSSYVQKWSPTRAHQRARPATAPRRPAKTKSWPPPTPTAPRDLEIQRLAAGLTTRMPWLLDSGRHIGWLCNLLERHELARRCWTVSQLLDAIDRAARERHILVRDPGDQRDPLRYFAWLLRTAIAPASNAPQVALDEERRARRAQVIRDRAAAAKRRAQLELEAGAIDEVLAAMRQQFPRSTRHR